MANKDLNLSLDQSLIKGQNNAPVENKQTETFSSGEQQATTSVFKSPGTKPFSTESTASEPLFSEPPVTAESSVTSESSATKAASAEALASNKQASTSAASQLPAKSPFRLDTVTVGLLLLVVLNFSAIVLMLTQQPSDTAKTVTVYKPIIPQSFSDSVTESLGSLKSGVQSMQQELASIRLQASETQQQLASHHALTTSRFDQLQATSKKASLPPPQKTTHWYVNLGTFSQNEAARQLQQQLQSLGFKPDIQSAQINNQIVNRVRLSGFDNQVDAEKAAKAVMEKTDLSGLWVWTDE